MTNLSVEPIAMTSGVPAKPRFFTLSLLPRLVGFSVLFFIVWLLFSTLFMPLMSTSATRAILDAPVILLTTPIDGVVSSLKIRPGEAFEKGQTIATIENPRANQETLLALQTRRLTLEQQLGSLKGQAEHDQQFYNALEKTSRQYQDAYRVRQQLTQRALRAESAAADARLQDAQATVTRNLDLFRQGAVSEATVASSKAQLASLQGAAESVRSQLRINSGDTSAASEQVYLDPDQLRLYDLRAQMTTLQLSLANQAKHQATQQEELDNLNRLIETEQNRVRLMAAYQVVTYAPGTVQELVAPEGTLVRAGATLVRATHCSQSNVIAVFPERMASKINRDTVLRVKIAGMDHPLDAQVTQLLSKPSDTLAANYSVPFPFAEQNAVYVVGVFDDNLSQSDRARTCSPGNWVSVEVAR